MATKKINIHIGLHKTGTTYLQRSVFPQLKSVHLHRGMKSHRDLMAADFSKQILISDEGISGRLWKGDYLESFKENLKKIKSLYGDPRIIIGVRKQKGFILSVYKQFLHEKGYKDIGYLYNVNETGLIKDHELLFAPRIKLIKEMFSEVFVYSQETLFKKPEAFADSLASFLDIEDNIDMNSLTLKSSNEGVKTNVQVRGLKQLNRINRFLERIHPSLSLYSRALRALKLTPRHFCQDYLKRVGGKKYELENKVSEHIQSHFEKDWNECQKHISF